MIEELKSLFIGNDRSIGQWNPKTNKLHTIKDQPLEDKHWKNHIDGVMGIGMVPILDDHQCWWGAIDIDCHGEDVPEIDLIELEAKVTKLDLPLAVCRTKSGGAHVYCFASKPMKASLMQDSLTQWAGWLGYKGAEIFPKQTKLAGKGQSRARGNWLNMPYFGGKNTDRYCVHGGKKVGVHFFLEYAESIRVSPADILEKSVGEHGDAPPCIQEMMKNGVESGYRNLAMYNAVVYLKRAFPNDYRERAREFNVDVFDKPMEPKEAEKVIKSASRRDYQYKCQEEPCRSRCNASACVKRAFGIDEDEHSTLFLGGLPEFTRLDKILTDPFQWILYVDGKSLPPMSISQLMDYRHVRAMSAEVLHRMPPSMKLDKWAQTLDGMLQDCNEVEAPEDASVSGVILNHLADFLQRTDFDADPEDSDLRQRIKLGSPVLQNHQGNKVIFFEGKSFVDYLKKKRADEKKGHQLWAVLRMAGVQHTKVSIAGTKTNVWFVIPETDENDTFKPVEFNHGF